MSFVPWLLFLTQTLVFQQGDTLLFMAGDRRLDMLITGAITQNLEDGSSVTRTISTRISADHKFYFIHEEFLYTQPESVFTRIVLYTADRKTLLSETRSGLRRIAFEITKLQGNSLILGTVNKDYSRPRLELLRPDRAAQILIAEDVWPKIVQYEVSPHFRHIVLHARRLVGTRMMDFIYARDLRSGQSWEYGFPVCLTCRRSTITISVDDQGRVENVYKNEHRIFNQSGEMIDLHLETE
jgi:hypothetical protein